MPSTRDINRARVFELIHLLDIDALIVGGDLPESVLTELMGRVSNQLDEFYIPGWSQPLSVRQSQNRSDTAALGAATLPIHDVFALSAQVKVAGNSLF